MKPKRISKVWILAVFALGIIVSPALAHERVWRSPDRKFPAHPIAHTHNQDAPDELNADGFNPIQGAVSLAGGIYKTVEGTIRAVFSSPKGVEKTEKK